MLDDVQPELMRRIIVALAVGLVVALVGLVLLAWWFAWEDDRDDQDRAALAAQYEDLRVRAEQEGIEAPPVEDFVDVDENDPEIQDPEEQDPERQDPEMDDPDPNDPDPNDPEAQDAESQDGEVDDPEVQDGEVDDPDPDDPESQDPEVQDPEVDDPDPDDPDQGCPAGYFLQAVQIAGMDVAICVAPTPTTVGSPN